MERDDEIVVTRRAALALLLGLAACAGGTGTSPATMGRAAKLEPPGWVGPGLEVFDRVVLDAMERGRIPGASLAIAHRGRLVLARGYGVADVETGARVEPETLFMLASVSKSLTAATILKQVEQGRLALDARVLDVLDYLRPPGGELRDPRWREITIEMLLYHEGGWDRTTSGDPLTWEERVARAMHVRPPVSPEVLARYMLGQPLDFTPGTKAVYSNFGYLLLGLVVERVSGRPYTETVQALTLGPMGIAGMVNGAARDDRAYTPGEARRYGPRNQLAPGGLPPAHFASGAWIGSTVDLVRFLSAIDGTRMAPFLSPGLTARMLAGDPSGVGRHPHGGAFGMGWDNVERLPHGVLFEKDGGVLGTMTWIEHDPPDIDWALFFNRSLGKPLGPEVHQEFRGGMKRSIESVAVWPDVDFFNRVR